jgi:hypothetical protein
MDLADHFKTLPDGAEKTALAMKVLGRSGAELIPLLNAGGAAIEELGSKAVIMTEEQIEASKHLVLTQQKLASVNAATVTLASETANTVFAGPTAGSGVPSFRALVAADLPATTVTPGSYGEARNCAR